MKWADFAKEIDHPNFYHCFIPALSDKEVITEICDKKKPVVLFTYGGDWSVFDCKLSELGNTVSVVDALDHYTKLYRFMLPKNIVRWYSTNMNIIISGITQCIPLIGWEREESKPEAIHNLVYLNFTINHSLRWSIWMGYQHVPWVTYSGKSKHASFEPENFEPEVWQKYAQTYKDELAAHKFAFAPPGNGPDTFRAWQSLAVKTIPIVQNIPMYNYFGDLPLLMVDDFLKLNPEVLNEAYDIMMNKEWNWQKLDIKYWKEAIIKDCEAIDERCG